MVDIRQLRYFQAVAEELHFGRAAARLAIAQPALSRRQVQQLEEALGTPLLRRTQRRVELLPAGALLLERSRAIQQDLARALSDVRRTGAGELGRLALGFIHSSTYGLLPSIIGRFRQLYPGIELELHELPITAQHAALVRGTIDLGLLRVQAAPAELEVVPVMPDPFVLAVPAKHRLAARTRVRLKDVAGEPFVMFSKDGAPLFPRARAGDVRAGRLQPGHRAARHADPHGGGAGGSGAGRRGGSGERAQPASQAGALPGDRRQGRAGARGAGLAARARDAGDPVLPAGDAGSGGGVGR
nr:LysR substrate-binding domain-containing protein [Ramlibacter montanisoli]